LKYINRLRNLNKSEILKIKTFHESFLHFRLMIGDRVGVKRTLDGTLRLVDVHIF